MFIPIGFLLGDKGRKAIPAAAGISLAIELTQLITRRGLCEFDDIVHNCTGAVIGLFLYGLVKKCSHRIDS
jgi:glycopeptide antibiotics resistance protein